MTDTMNEPISTRNLDRYGSAELPWSRPRDILASDTPDADLTFFVATVRPNGRPHSAGVGAVWVDDACISRGAGNAQVAQPGRKSAAVVGICAAST
jgi:hypothetical protein